MGKRLPYTPKSKIIDSLRRLWLRSRERQAALHRDKYSCQVCGAKQSRAKGREVYVEVHHIEAEFNRRVDEIVAKIRELLLVDPSEMVTLCVDCHKKEHENNGF